MNEIMVNPITIKFFEILPPSYHTLMLKAIPLAFSVYSKGRKVVLAVDRIPYKAAILLSLAAIYYYKKLSKSRGKRYQRHSKLFSREQFFARIRTLLPI